MSLARNISPTTEPNTPRARHQIGLLNLMAFVVLAGAAFGTARRVRDAASHTWDERTTLLPLLALAFWLGVVLAEGIVARLRRPAGHAAPWRGIAWRLVAILTLAAFLASQTSLLSQLEQLQANLAILNSQRQVPQVVRQRTPVGLQASKIHFRLQFLDVGLAALLFGVSTILAPARRVRPGREAAPGRRPDVAGWLFILVLGASPFLVAWWMRTLRPWTLIEGLPGDDVLTSRGRMAPTVALGLLAWLGAAEWLRRDLRSPGPRLSTRSICYRLATLGAVVGSGLVLAFGPLRHEPTDARAFGSAPLDLESTALLVLAAIGLAGGLVARASGPVVVEGGRRKGRMALARAAKAGGIVLLAALALLMAFLDEPGWELVMILQTLWPSPGWRWWYETALEYSVLLGGIDPHVVLWSMTIVVLAIPIVARLGPRDARRPRGASPWWATVRSASLAALGVLALLAIAAPYPIQTYRFWGGAFRRASPVLSEALDWLEFHLHDPLDSVDVELILLAPGVYWLASRWYDSFAPPPAAPLDALLVEGQKARGFLADWAAVSVLVVAALPIAYATFVLLLG